MHARTHTHDTHTHTLDEIVMDADVRDDIRVHHSVGTAMEVVGDL